MLGGQSRRVEVLRKVAWESWYEPLRMQLESTNKSITKIQALFRGQRVRTRPLAVVIEEYKQQRAWDDIKNFEATKIQKLVLVAKLEDAPPERSFWARSLARSL